MLLAWGCGQGSIGREGTCRPCGLPLAFHLHLLAFLQLLLAFLQHLYHQLQEGRKKVILTVTAPFRLPSPHKVPAVPRSPDKSTLSFSVKFLSCPTR